MKILNKFNHMAYLAKEAQLQLVFAIVCVGIA